GERAEVLHRLRVGDVVPRLHRGRRRVRDREVGDDARRAVAPGQDVVAGDGLDDARGTGLRAVVVERGCRVAVRAARNIGRRRRGRGQDVAAAAAAAGTVAFAGAGAGRLLQPGAPAVAALGLNRQSTERADLRGEEDRAAGAAAAAAVAADVRAVESVGCER